MTQHTTPTSGAAIQRYKIGYHADECGQRSSTPSGIPDASGSWVRYADHVAALAAGQAVAPVEKWADRVQRAHPKSEPEFWPDELRVKYMAEEIRDLRATRPAPHAMDGGEDAEELRLLLALAFSVERAIGNGVMPLDIEEAYEGYDKWFAARAAQKEKS